jgi:hypothetical protein
MITARDDGLAGRRELLATRAAWQRVQLTAALRQARDDLGSPLRLGRLALRVAAARVPPAASPTARPWLLSAAWLVVRALRTSPTARWLAAGGVAFAAIWWVAHAVKSPPEAEDDSG